MELRMARQMALPMEEKMARQMGTKKAHLMAQDLATRLFHREILPNAAPSMKAYPRGAPMELQMAPEMAFVMGTMNGPTHVKWMARRKAGGRWRRDYGCGRMWVHG